MLIAELCEKNKQALLVAVFVLWTTKGFKVLYRNSKFAAVKKLLNKTGTEEKRDGVDITVNENNIHSKM